MTEGSDVGTDGIWSYRPGSGHREGLDLTGFRVEATDGIIGHVDRQADDTPQRHLIVDTGAWVFGRSLVIPAGTVTGVDERERTVTVACTRADAKEAPGSRRTARPVIRGTSPPSVPTTHGCPMRRRLRGSRVVMHGNGTKGTGRECPRDGGMTTAAQHRVRARRASRAAARTTGGRS